MLDNPIGGFSGILHPLRNRRTENTRGRRISSLSSHFLAISRTRISCLDALERTACAPFREERCMKFTEATKFHRKSGGEPQPLKGLSSSRSSKERRKIPLHEDLVRIVRTFWPFPENPGAWGGLSSIGKSPSMSCRLLFRRILMPQITSESGRESPRQGLPPYGD